MSGDTAFGLAAVWRLNNRANLMLLDDLNNEQLSYTANPRARNIGDQFAHLHNVRLQWLEVQGERTLARIEKGAPTKAQLRAALEQSSDAMAGVIERGESGARIKGHRRGVAAFCGYQLAHEAHHRGQIILHLKYARMPVSREVAFGIWDWDKL